MPVVCLQVRDVGVPGSGQLRGEMSDQARRQRSPVDALGEVRAIDEFHDEVVWPSLLDIGLLDIGVEKLHERRVIE